MSCFGPVTEIMTVTPPGGAAQLLSSSQGLAWGGFTGESSTGAA